MRVLSHCYSITVPASSSVIVVSAMLIVASVFMFIGSIIVVFFGCLIFVYSLNDNEIECYDDHARDMNMMLLMVMI